MSAGTILIVCALLIVVYNNYVDQQAGAAADKIGAQVEELTTDAGGDSNPDIMDTVQVDGNSYVGMIRIPALSINLPVLESWSLPNLKIAPCRYKGTAANNNLIICAHNYKKHFGLLNTLSTGDEVIFDDVKGKRITYQVIEIVTLQPTDVAKMEEGDWDLTLFSCTYMGYARVTVRCRRIY